MESAQENDDQEEGCWMMLEIGQMLTPPKQLEWPKTDRAGGKGNYSNSYAIGPTVPRGLGK
jgi:hypothetical protein